LTTRGREVYDGYVNRPSTTGGIEYQAKYGTDWHTVADIGKFTVLGLRKRAFGVPEVAASVHWFQEAIEDYLALAVLVR
jgi:hypothetical protein